MIAPLIETIEEPIGYGPGMVFPLNWNVADAYDLSTKWVRFEASVNAGVATQFKVTSDQAAIVITDQQVTLTIRPATANEVTDPEYPTFADFTAAYADFVFAVDFGDDSDPDSAEKRVQGTVTKAPPKGAFPETGE